MTRKGGLFVIPPCEEAMEWSSRALDARLTFRQRLLLKLHFRLCRSCCEYRDQISILHYMIERLYAHNGPGCDAPFTALSPECKTRMKQQIDSHSH